MFCYSLFLRLPQPDTYYGHNQIIEAAVRPQDVFPYTHHWKRSVCASQEFWLFSKVQAQPSLNGNSARFNRKEISFQYEHDMDSDDGEEMAPIHPEEMAFYTVVACGGYFIAYYRFCHGMLASENLFHPGRY